MQFEVTIFDQNSVHSCYILNIYCINVTIPYRPEKAVPPALNRLNQLFDFDQSHIHTYYWSMRVNKILVTIFLYSRSHQLFDTSTFGQNGGSTRYC